ncbi:putative cyclase [Penicillium digitatum]|uniref:Putative cyclase n=1 Tax=Penicillium digitatum TaxID=36651 RepID=A0A7T7BII1_PENDI|nr:putative cyclase [Penicillium digitatum]
MAGSHVGDSRHQLATQPSHLRMHELQSVEKDLSETTEERNNGTHSLRYPLRHFSQTVPGQSERVFYGGTTSEEISDRQNDRQNDRIGLQHWAREGIAGRGVLIDYATWAEKKGMEYTTFSTHQVRFADILENAEENNITFQRGDILFVYPPQSPDIFLHEYVLAGWGMPIGELFDLEALARTCQELQRWSFFVASVPLNMPGGVSPPPNVMAIF